MKTMKGKNRINLQNMKKETKTINRVQILYLMSFLIFVVITGALFFGGYDLLLVFFTLTTANIFLVIAASSGHSPYSFMGAGRELIQMLAYEPMVLITVIGLYCVNRNKRQFAAGCVFDRYFCGIYVYPHNQTQKTSV